MSTRPAEFSYLGLVKNLQSVVDQHNAVLDENLECTQGNFLNCQHIKILKLVLERLQSSPVPTQNDFITLACIKKYFQFYETKLEKLNAISHKLSTPTLAAIHGVMQQVLQHIDSLQEAARRAEPVAPAALESGASDEEKAQRLLRKLKSMCGEWHLFRDIDAAVRCINEEDGARQAIHALGGKLSPVGRQMVLTPPVAFFSAPLPVIILGQKIGELLQKLSADQEYNQPLSATLLDSLSRLTRTGRTRYPDHVAIFDCFFNAAKMLEIKRYSALQLNAALTSLSQCNKLTIASAVRNENARQLIQSFQGCYDKMSAARESYQLLQCSTAISESELTKLQIGAELAYRSAHKLIITIWTPIVESYHKALSSSLRQQYADVFNALDSCKDQIPRPEKRLPAAGFSKTRSFSDASPIIPSPEQFEQFLPIRFAFHAVLEQPKAPSGPLPLETAHMPIKVSRTKDCHARKLRHEDQQSAPSATQRAPSPQPPQGKTAEADLVTPPEGRKAQPKEVEIPQDRKEAKPQAALAADSPLITVDTPFDEGEQWPFHFRVGDGVIPSLNFAWHVRRWYDPSYDPFVSDSHYSSRSYSSEVKTNIRFEHMLPLALLRVVLEQGQQYVDQHVQEESRFLAAEVLRDGGAYDLGVITVARNLQTGVIFHVGFSQLSPTTLQERYAKGNMFQPVTEVPAQEQETPRPYLTLPDDGSYISDVEETFQGMYSVTVYDPDRRITVTAYIDNREPW
jgi:hypothetical protein